jgi:membrane-associated phospholipid phosphatase
MATASSPAFADPAPAPALQPGGPFGESRIRAAESAGIGVAAATAVLLQLVLKAPEAPRWSGGFFFDDAARRTLVASSPSGRSRAALASDVGYYGLMAYPLLVDAAFVTWMGRGQADAAAQLALMDVQALAINGLLTTLLQRTVGRNRPDAQGCVAPAAPGSRCSAPANDRNGAFPSGHSSFAFTGAVLMCMQHSRLRLYGDADPFVCPIALTAAASTAILRVVADRHWTSDVLAGAALGSAVGALVSIAHLHAPSAVTAPLSGQFDGHTATVSYGLRF